MAASWTAARGTRLSWSRPPRWKKKWARWRSRRKLSAISFQLEQIPLISVEIFENGNRAVTLLARFFFKLDATRRHLQVVAPEVVGVEKKKHSSAGLVADAARLLGRGGSCEKQIGAARLPRSNEYPALVLA